MLQDQSGPGPNTLGAFIFFGYIVAAISISGVVLRSIFTLSVEQGEKLRRTKDAGANKKGSNRPKSQDADFVQAERGRRIMFPLAVASFTMLSWNMLNFLIVSYLRWATDRGIGITLQEALGSRVGRGHNIWVWATSSTLFQTFAEDLLLDNQTTSHVRAALLYSFGSSMWMSITGYEMEIPVMWAYFLLSQILPMSFAQNLFCCAVLLRSGKPRRHARPLMRTRYTLTVCYTALLFCINRTIGTIWFLPALLGIRMMLFAPLIIESAAAGSRPIKLDLSTTSEAWYAIRRCIIGGTLCATIDLLASNGVGALLKPYNELNYAAAALTNDMLLGLSSGAVYTIVCQRRPGRLPRSSRP